MNTLRCLLLALAGFAGLGTVGAQSPVKPNPVVIPGPADRLFGEIVLDGSITNWWGRPTAELRTEAAGGNADAELALARVLLSGPDRSQHLEEARQRIARAADGNQSQAQYLMGYLALHPEPFFPGGEYVQDFGSAVDWFELSAAGGSVRACYEIAQLYNFGKLPRNYREVERWYQKAAERGHTPSTRALVDLFRADHTNADGSKFPANPAKTEQWQSVLEDQLRRQEKGNRAPVGGRGSAPDSTASPKPSASPTPTPTPLREPEIPQDIVAEMASSLGPRELQFFKQALSNALERGNEIPGVSTPRGGKSRASARDLLTQAQTLETAAQTPEQREEVLQRYGQVPRFPVTAEARAAASGILRIYREARLDPEHTAPRPLLPLDPELLPNPEEQLQLAELLLRGNAFIQAQPWVATPRLLTLARQGNATAMRRIGELWKQGAGGNADPEEAARWFARAAAMEAKKP